MGEAPLLYSEAREMLRAAARDVLTCLRFYSRLPLPRFRFEAPARGLLDFAVAVRMVPIAGAIIGCFGAGALLILGGLGLPPFLCAAAALAALMLVTGALHEDGLADVADGLGGGGDPEHKLAIMKDSRIGSFGAAALGLALIVRTAAIAALVERAGLWGAAGAILASAAASRTAGLIPLALLPPARAEGASHAAGRPKPEALTVAAGLAIALAVILGVPAVGWKATVAAGAFAPAAGLCLAHLARRHIGGQTGDVAGAAQQCAEIAFLSGLLVRS